MAQVHGMKMENGVMLWMFEIEGGLVIPAGQTVELKSKSTHVIHGPRERPVKDTRFKATLLRESGTGRGRVRRADGKFMSMEGM